MQKFKESELDKASLEHDMAYGDFKDFPKVTTSDKVLCNKVFNIAKNKKYDRYQLGLTSMVYNFFKKKVLWRCCYTSK